LLALARLALVPGSVVLEAGTGSGSLTHALARAVAPSGRVDVASTDQEQAAKCLAMIREITAEAEIGKLYMGVVKRITDFGAFVEIFPGTDGLVHISHLANERVNKVTDVVNEGDEVLVRVIDIDKQGKIRLSRKEALEDV
jgi:polyribonucleotide nucleotidyltransferase